MKRLKLTYRDLIYVFLNEYSTIRSFFNGDEKYDALLGQLEIHKRVTEDRPLQKVLLKAAYSILFACSHTNPW